MEPYALFAQARHLASDPSQTRWLLPLMLLGDAFLTGLVIWKVPYTEIDFMTYMAQARTYLKGVRDYSYIEGPTGPCVYPAAHLYMYSILYKITDGGKNIVIAQWVFGGLYLLCLALIGWIYQRCNAPPYLLPLLMLSKRLHSIFVLRLFNDCFALLLLLISILFYQRKRWEMGSIALSLGIGFKMSLLLAVPGALVIMGQVMALLSVAIQIAIMFAVQVQIGIPFARVNTEAYLSRAFEFSRQFLFRWTVNWRFVGESIFLSREFSLSLLLIHASLLLSFALTRWIRPAGLSIPSLVKCSLSGFPNDQKRETEIRLKPEIVTRIMFTSIVIGMLCARSLHYQFYAYIVWATPFLMWKAGTHPMLIYSVWAIQEWGWNVFPSTALSSLAVVICLALQTVVTWTNNLEDL